MRPGKIILKVRNGIAAPAGQAGFSQARPIWRGICWPRVAAYANFPAVKFPFVSKSSGRTLRQPARSTMPDLESVHLGAQYRGARVGGDFFDFTRAGDSRLLLLLLDIAGKRDEALDIAAAVQDVFRGSADLFADEAVNEAVALSQLLLDINRAILSAAGGVRCAPGFVACYNESLGTLCYVNAGHTAALVKDSSGIVKLDPTGLPLGLFSHATHDASMCVLEPGATLLLVSRGLAEVKGAKDEFGIERACQFLHQSAAGDPQQLCRDLIENVRVFVEDGMRRGLLNKVRGNNSVGDEDPLSNNDITAVALSRAAKAAAVAR